MSFRIKPTNKSINKKPVENPLKLDMDTYSLYTFKQDSSKSTNSFDMPSPKYVKGPVVRTTTQSQSDFY